MRSLALRLVLTASALLAAGCFDIRHDLRVSPDGTVEGQLIGRLQARLAEDLPPDDELAEMLRNWCPAYPLDPAMPIPDMVDPADLPAFEALDFRTTAFPSRQNAFTCVHTFRFNARMLDREALRIFPGNVEALGNGHLITLGGPRGRAVLFRGVTSPRCHPQDVGCPERAASLRAGLGSDDPEQVAAAQAEVARQIRNAIENSGMDAVRVEMRLSGHLRASPELRSLGKGVYAWSGSLLELFSSAPKIFVPPQTETP